MENAACAAEPFLRCRVEHDLPARLIGERDLVTFPAVGEICLEVGGPGGDPHTGHRVRISSHRLAWRKGRSSGSPDLADEPIWFAIRLDEVVSVEIRERFMRARRCVLELRDGKTIAVMFVSHVSPDDFTETLKQAVLAAEWRDGSFEVASIGGLQRLLGHRGAKQQAAGEALDVAFQDLEALKRCAAQAVSAARVVANSAAPGSNDASDLRQLLDDFGCLLGPDGKPVAKGGTTREDVQSDVVRVCTAALEAKRRGSNSLGGMLLAHDVFCLVNRARGMALVSPEEVMLALRNASVKGGPLRLRTLSSNMALAVSLARDDSAADARRLVQLATDAAARGAPLSAFSLASELGLVVTEAEYLLRDAEQEAVLVRDDAPADVFYYVNFFDDFDC